MVGRGNFLLAFLYYFFWKRDLRAQFLISRHFISLRKKEPKKCCCSLSVFLCVGTGSECKE